MGKSRSGKAGTLSRGPAAPEYRKARVRGKSYKQEVVGQFALVAASLPRQVAA